MRRQTISSFAWSTQRRMWLLQQPLQQPLQQQQQQQQQEVQQQHQQEQNLREELQQQQQQQDEQYAHYVRMHNSARVYCGIAVDALQQVESQQQHVALLEGRVSFAQLLGSRIIPLFSYGF